MTTNLPDEGEPKVSPLQKILSQLPSGTKASLATADSISEEKESDDQFDSLLDSLPSSSRNQVSMSAAGLTEAEAIEAIGENIKPKWCLCEQPDGEFPIVRVFKDPFSLARRISALEGESVSVWPFFGVPLRITKPDELSGVRRIYLPGEAQSVSIPKYKSEQPKLRDTPPDENVEWQDDGWLGDPIFTETISEDFYTRKPEAKAKKKGKNKTDKPASDEDSDFENT